MISNAFTCTGSYAILIMLGIKRVENRSMCPSPMKGRCAVSCSKSFCKEEFGNFIQWASQVLPADQFAQIPAWKDVADWPGKIVGCVDYSCHEGGDDGLWDEGYRYWWKLSEVVSFDIPIPCRGNTGMWELPASVMTRVTLVDNLAQAVGTKIVTVDDAARIFKMAIPLVGENEGFFVLSIDGGGRVLVEPTLVSLGDTRATVVCPADVFAVAVRESAASIIVAHNHPSGNLSVSSQDQELTMELEKIGDIMNIKLLDHLVLNADGQFVSVRK